MKKYMVILEDLDGCEVSFFDDFDAGMSFVESSRDDGWYAEVYQRNARRFEGRIIGFEYRRVD